MKLNINIVDKRDTYIGTYAYVPIDKNIRYQDVVETLRSKGIPVSCTHPHITCMYSNDEYTADLPDRIGVNTTCTVTKLEYWEGHDKRGYIVAMVDNDSLHVINARLATLCEPVSFDTFMPHLTVAENIKMTLPLQAAIRAVNQDIQNVNHLQLSYTQLVVEDLS